MSRQALGSARILSPSVPAHGGQKPGRLGVPTPVETIGIASSTGGPQALKIVLAGLRDARPVPIFITQHIRPSFTAMLAGQLEDAIGRPCTEAVDREPVQRDGVYLAPGGHHMLVQAGRGGPVLRLSNEAPVHYCRPAADPMLASIAAIYRARSLAIVLTGIGEDGLAGCAAIRAAGGGVIVQDEGSSVVWGMPGAVARRGLAHATLPPDEIARLVAAALAR
jgi:two-component system chemotaxis response regulator CheB